MTRPSAISIVIPTYNVSAYIAPCLASLQAQILEHFDVVIVNDGSTDDSAEVARAYVKNDDRFVVIDQENRGPGPGGGRNGGLAHTRSDRLIFLDSDDALLPGALASLVDAFEAVPGLDIATTSAARLSGATLRPSHFHDISHPRPERSTNARKSPWLMFDSTPWNKAFRREFFDRVVGAWPEQQLYEDIAPMTRAILAAEQIAVLCEPHYMWRVRGEGSITHTQASVRGDLAQLEQLEIARDLVLLANDESLLTWFDWKTLNQDLLWMTIKLLKVTGDERTTLFTGVRQALEVVDARLIDATSPALRRCYATILGRNELATTTQVVRNRLALLQDRRTPERALAAATQKVSLQRVVGDAGGLTLWTTGVGIDLRGADLEIHRSPPWSAGTRDAPVATFEAHRQSRSLAAFRIDAGALPAGTRLENWFVEIVDRQGVRGEITRSLADALKRRLIGENPTGLSPLAAFFDDGRVRIAQGVVEPAISEARFVNGRVELRGHGANSTQPFSTDMKAWLTRPITNDVFEIEWWHDETQGFCISVTIDQLQALAAVPHAISVTADANPAIAIPIGITAPLVFQTNGAVNGRVAGGPFGEAHLQVVRGPVDRVRALVTEFGSYVPAGLTRNRPS